MLLVMKCLLTAKQMLANTPAGFVGATSTNLAEERAITVDGVVLDNLR
jgi:hypothetical protein